MDSENLNTGKCPEKDKEKACQGDIFYSESNMRYLKKVIDDVESGKAHFEEHKLLEEE